MSLSLLLLAPLASLVAAPAAAQAADPFQDELDALQVHVRSLEGEPLTSEEVADLLARLGSIEDAYQRGAWCDADQGLDELLLAVQALRARDRTGPVDDLYNRAHHLARNFHQTAPRNACTDEGFLMDARIDLTSSDIGGLAGQLHFGHPHLSTLMRGGQTWTELTMGPAPLWGPPGAMGDDVDDGEPGFPGLPIHASLFAIPVGATLRTDMAPSTGTPFALELLPVQPPREAEAAPQTPDDYHDDERPPDSLFADMPFTVDEEAYALDRNIPAEPCKAEILGDLRGVRIGRLACAVGQYNPAMATFTPFTSVAFDIRFDGGEDHFVTRAALDPFDTHTHQLFGPPGAASSGVLLNNAILYDNAAMPGLFGCIGEELLILTHPSLRDEADKLADWKNTRGLMTRVFNVADGAGPGPDSAAQIDAFIEDRYEDCSPRPSYVLLMGDAELVPTFYVQRENKPAGVMVATDFFYAEHSPDLSDVFADLGVGRFPVDTLAQANVVVDKTIAYEGSPPSDESFYNTVSIAAEFECCMIGTTQYGRERSPFIETGEVVRQGVVLSGDVVERLYKQGTTKADYTNDTTPRRLWQGALLSSAIGPASSYPWDADANDIHAAFDAGRTFIMHADHGWSKGWATPGFSTNDVASLDNGALTPIVFSMNCNTGQFDFETDGDAATPAGDVTFAEALLRREGGGAVGVFAGTRMTNTWWNEALGAGFVDSLYPHTVPFGGPTAQRHLGDVLNHGKLYLIVKTIDGTYATSNLRNHLWLYNLFGDPSLAARLEAPLVLSASAQVVATSSSAQVQYEHEGAWVTAFQFRADGDGEAAPGLPGSGHLVPLGRAAVVGGVANIDWGIPPDDTQPILYAADAEHGVGTLLQGPGITPVPELDVFRLSVLGFAALAVALVARRVR